MHPHQALEMATPAERFRLPPLVRGKVSVPADARADHRGQWVVHGAREWVWFE